MGIYEISKMLTRPARLETALSGVVNLLNSFLDMSGGLIALLDEEDRTTTVVGAGWNEAEAKEHFERLPEQAVGQIVVSGMPLVVRDVARSPLFAEWSELKAEGAAAVRSFVGVPIKGEKRTIGTITIERVGSQSSPGTLDEDVRYLTMIANLVGQTVALQTMVERDRERLMAERNRLEQELEERNAAKHEGISWIIGVSPAIREVTEKVQLVARCNLPVLLCGESGTGKELFARAIHEYSPRKEQPYIRLNCAALSETVLESELFGHDKGAFTGAIGMRKGRFEMADGGTLFLDEIGEISTTFQAKLLRVLQEGEFERVGGNHTIKVDVRLVTATNRNLEAAVICRRLPLGPLLSHQRGADLSARSARAAGGHSAAGARVCEALQQGAWGEPEHLAARHGGADGVRLSRQRARTGELRAAHGGADQEPSVAGGGLRAEQQEQFGGDG